MLSTGALEAPPNKKIKIVYSKNTNGEFLWKVIYFQVIFVFVVETQNSSKKLFGVGELNSNGKFLFLVQ